MKLLKLHIAVVLLCTLLLSGVLGLAWHFRPPAEDDRWPPLALQSPPAQPDEVPQVQPLDFVNRIKVQFSDDCCQFGIICTKLPDPRDPTKPKLLTHDEQGSTNNTCVRIDGRDYLFGWEKPGLHRLTDQAVPIPGMDPAHSWTTAMDHQASKVRITQSVEIVIGEQTRLYDTALVTYRIENRDSQPHTVGLRFLLDVRVGVNDAPPFYIPPVMQEGRIEESDRLSTPLEIFPGKKLPDFILALETGDLNDPKATVAILGLRLHRMEPLDKLVICRSPDSRGERWGGTNNPGDWKYQRLDEPAGKPQDSCVLLYWQEAAMPPRSERTLGFTYGLGRISSDPGCVDPVPCFGQRMRLFVHPRVTMNRPFEAIAYVLRSKDPQQTVTLRLAAGLTLAPREKATQRVPRMGKEGYSQVCWRVIPYKFGTFKVIAEAPTIGVCTEQVTLRNWSIFE